MRAKQGSISIQVCHCGLLHDAVANLFAAVRKIEPASTPASYDPLMSTELIAHVAAAVDTSCNGVAEPINPGILTALL